MIIHSVIQGSTEWLRLRSGVPTASCFDKIYTPKGKMSTQAEKYMWALLAERMMLHPVTDHVSFWMDRGSRMEAEAVSYYEGVRDLDTVKVGFITNDSGMIGASPDRLVGDDGLVEIKIPKESTHVGYMITRAVDSDYYPQIMGQLWVTGRKWVDIMSYHPELPPAIVHVKRDEAYIAGLSSAVEAFSAELERMSDEFRAKGWIKDPNAVLAGGKHLLCEKCFAIAPLFRFPSDDGKISYICAACLAPALAKADP